MATLITLPSLSLIILVIHATIDLIPFKCDTICPYTLSLVDIVDYGCWWENDTLITRGGFLREAPNGG